jgi:hypothetical protein
MGRSRGLGFFNCSSIIGSERDTDSEGDAGSDAALNKAAFSGPTRSSRVARKRGVDNTKNNRNERLKPRIAVIWHL